MALLNVSANDVDAANVSIDAELPIAWLDQQLADADVRGQLPGRVRAQLSRSGGDVIVRGRVSAKISTPCARYLDPAPIDVDTELSLMLKPAPPEPARGKAAKPEAKPARRRGTKE